MQDGRDSSGSTGSKRPWIRGVNIGGWLLLERFITPYMFALTSCHLQGDFCWYPGQLSAPPLDSKKHKYCNLFECEGLKELPVDEYTLTDAFPNKALARAHLTHHWEHFVTKEDVKTLKETGVTHARVSMPHWILGDIGEDEPYVDGQWLYFVRFVGWCREFGIEVWPDIHTAPGSQNGFDNSGQYLEDGPTCQHWSDSKTNVERSLQVVQDISDAIVRDNLQDVVTGFGVLNEPFSDCNVLVVEKFYNDALNRIRTTLGEGTAVYIGDMFNSAKWNNGWWTDEDQYSNTFLDSHYYQGTKDFLALFLLLCGSWMVAHIYIYIFIYTASFFCFYNSL
jgi:glucan 1,3-beta-glucosidase